MRYLLTTVLVFLTAAIFAQSRSNIGIGFGLNKPFSNDYNIGTSVELQGNIALSGKLAIAPAIGYSRINSKGGYIGDLSAGNPIENLDLAYIRLALKYHFYRNWFISGAPLLYMANFHGETDGIGVGGSGTFGYNLDIGTYSTLIFSINTDIINITSNGNGVTPIAGLKLAYVINFKKAK